MKSRGGRWGKCAELALLDGQVQDHSSLGTVTPTVLSLGTQNSRLSYFIVCCITSELIVCFTVIPGQPGITVIEVSDNITGSFLYTSY